MATNFINGKVFLGFHEQIILKFIPLIYFVTGAGRSTFVLQNIENKNQLERQTDNSCWRNKHASHHKLATIVCHWSYVFFILFLALNLRRRGVRYNPEVICRRKGDSPSSFRHKWVTEGRRHSNGILKYFRDIWVDLSCPVLDPSLSRTQE